MGRMTFEKWFAETEWWKENSRLEDFKPVWEQLRRHFAVAETRQILDDVIAAMRDEYGA